MLVLHYSDLTSEDKKLICNGCGAKGSFIKVPNFLFKASCNQHDFYYWRGSNDDAREIADKEFYQMMKVDIQEKKYSVFRKLWYYQWAYTYYQAVRWFGKGAFYFNVHSRNAIDLKKLRNK